MWLRHCLLLTPAFELNPHIRRRFEVPAVGGSTVQSRTTADLLASPSGGCERLYFRAAVLSSNLPGSLVRASHGRPSLSKVLVLKHSWHVALACLSSR